MDYTFKKSTCERYDLRWGGCGWATIMIDENGGVFNAQSDYGDYSYSWPHHGRESFKHFILELAREGSYFLGKVSDISYFNHDETLKAWKKAIIEMRRDGECTREKAREAWDYLIDVADECYGNATVLELKVYESHEVGSLCSEPWYVFEVIKDYPPGAKCFAKEVLPMFAEILKKELAGDVVPVPA